ncbi:MAG: RNA-binding cell elongation regulator Jag/EloR [Thermodesulfobacteriota bacterium]|nr:RNA-binding cell elongation regulator Jag/EloR [Thermodesulfobacteriota bacterium]
MASSSEFEGKNVDAAVRNASRELNIPEDQLEYDVVSSGSSGIFGLVGVKNAKIQVKINNYDGGAENESSSMAEDREAIQSLLDETFADAGTGTPAKAESAAPSDKKARSRKPAFKKPGRKQTPKQTKQAPVSAETRGAEPEPVSDAEPAPQSFKEEDFEAGKVALQKILDVITSGSEVSIEPRNHHVQFTVTGGNAAVLIGKRGKTLKAIQHLVEKIIRKSCGETVNVLVDVEQYLEKREESLRALANKLADKTRQTGKPSTINRIDAFERKIVHDALRKDKRVRTRSVGSGDLRNVVIHPSKKVKRKQQQQDEQSA